MFQIHPLQGKNRRTGVHMCVPLCISVKTYVSVGQVDKHVWVLFTGSFYEFSVNNSRVQKKKKTNKPQRAL